MPANVGVSDAISSIGVGGGGTAEVGAEGAGDRVDDVEVRHAPPRGRQRRADPLDAAVEVGEGPVLLEERGGREDDVGEGRGLREEDLVRDDELAGVDRGADVRGVGVGLDDVLAEHDQRLELAGDGRVEHLRDPEAALGPDRNAPGRLEPGADLGVGDLLVAGEDVGHRAHVGGALDVVLPAQRVRAAAVGGADAAGQRREVAERPHALGAVRVLGDPEPPDDRPRLTPSP